MIILSANACGYVIHQVVQFHQSLRNPSLIFKEALIVSGPISFISPIAVHLLRSVSCLVIILRSNIVLLIYL